jgi:uncharacterized Zn finger protein
MTEQIPKFITVKVPCEKCGEEVETTVTKELIKRMLKQYKVPPPQLPKGVPMIAVLEVTCRICGTLNKIPIPKKEAKVIRKGFMLPMKDAQRVADKYQEELLNKEAKKQGWVK